MSGRKRWLFRLLAVFVLPGLLFSAIEIGLRVGGYGYETTFFKTVQIGNEEYLIENDKFGWRFFPASLARSPAPLLVKARKPPGTYRIFILGESAALGDPRPAFGAPRYLKVLLQERFPGVKFEVVCAAMTAINSHAIVPIARECARYDGDLWVIYMGNNEMVGPFGAATVFGPRAPPIRGIRFALAVQRLRLGQWMMSLARRLGNGQPQEETWGGMRMFVQSQITPTDPRKEKVYASFKANLQDILDAGLDSGAKIILSQIIVNLEDCPPFASVTNLTAAGSASYLKSCADADAAGTSGDQTKALRLWTQAAQMNSRGAEVQFRLAESYQRSGDVSNANAGFALARDYDALPFRADSRINSIIDAVARQNARRGVRLCPMNAAVRSDRANFFDHVHFNFDGNYQVAAMWARQIEELLFSPKSDRSSANSEAWAAQGQCELRLGLTDWNRSATLEQMISRLAAPPFSGRFNNQSYVNALQDELRALGRTMDSGHKLLARSNYTQALAQDGADFYLRQNAAEFLETIGETEEAIGAWEKVRELIPHHFVAYFQIGRLLAAQSRFDQAEKSLRHALKLQPRLAEAWIEIGKIHHAQDKPELALHDFERAGKMNPHDYLPHYHLGKTLVRLNRRPEGIEQLREAVRLNPAHWETRYLLAGEQVADGQISAAREQLEEVVRLKPDHAMAHLNLGVAFYRLGENEKARRAISEALRLDPQNTTAQQYLKQLEGLQAPK